MKRFITFIAIALVSVFAMFADGTKPATNTGRYSIPCYKCRKETLSEPRQYNNTCIGCPTWRMYSIKHIEIDGNIYATYRCQHGHTLYVSLTSDDRR